MLGFINKLGPGFIILIAFLCFGAATILQLVVSIGLPTIKGLYFMRFTLANLGQTVTFGLWTICTDLYFSNSLMSDNGVTCQPVSLGYEGTQFGAIAEYLLIAPVAKALVVQPIACGFAGLATVACVLHLCTNFLLWPFITILAGALGILAFVFEIILFTTARVRLNTSGVEDYLGQQIESSTLGPAIWIQLAAAALVAFGTLMSWSAYIRRKVKKTHTGKMGTSVRGSVYEESNVGSYRPEKPAKRAGLFSMASTAPNKKGKPKGGLLSRLRGGGNQADDENSSGVAMRNMAAPLAGAAAGSKRSSQQDKRNSRSARVARVSGTRDFADYSSRRRARHASMPLPASDRGDRSRRSSGTGVNGSGSNRAARTAAFAGGAALGATRSSRSGSSAKDAYSSRRHSNQDDLRRQRSRRSQGSDDDDGNDMFHEADDGGDRADLGYLLGSRPYSYPAGRSRESVDRLSSERARSRSRPSGEAQLRARSRSRDPRRSSEPFAVKRKPAPALDRGSGSGSRGGGGESGYGSGYASGYGGRAETRSSGMSRYASEPMREADDDGFVSPRKGRRSARYSARMAEGGWD